MLDSRAAEVDPFVAMVEERQRLRRAPRLSDAERARLDKFLKITANSTSYGILARFDRRDLARNAEVTVYGSDEEPSTAKTRHPEDPGPYAFPPVAASLTAGARLMLALLERLITDAGGTYAFCDTDSMGIVADVRSRRVRCVAADSDEVRALSRAQVRQILGRFEDLNPYDRNLVPSLWKQEFKSLDRPLTCFAISAKRYVLLRDEGLVRVFDVPAELDAADDEPFEDGETVVDRSEHGLGLYLDPTNPDDPQRDDQDRRVWITQAWEWILGRRSSLPTWAREFALTRFTVSSPRVSDWFKRYNDSHSLSERVRPGSFGLLAHPSPFFRALSGGALPAAPYDRDPRHWGSLAWYDRTSGARLRVAQVSDLIDREQWSELRKGSVAVDSLQDVVNRYRLRPEHKSLEPNGGAATGETVGLLQRRAMLAAPALTDLVGKEGNRVLERLSGEVTETSDYRNEYGGRGDRWSVLLVPILREMGTAEVVRRTGISRSAVGRSLRESRATRPHGSTLAKYRAAALAWLTDREGPSDSVSEWGRLYLHLRGRSGETDTSQTVGP
jgi:hypothetical protein